jgi:hypothetical protein
MSAEGSPRKRSKDFIFPDLGDSPALVFPISIIRVNQW